MATSGFRTTQPAELRLATPLERLMAAVLDGILLLAIDIIALVLVSVVAATWRPGDTGGSLWSGALSFLSIAAVVGMIACWLAWGGTPGKLMLGLRIVDLQGRRLRWWQPLVRYGGYVLAAIPARLGLLGIVTHPRRQGWHDQLARTVVVKGWSREAEGRWQAPPAPRPPSPQWLGRLGDTLLPVRPVEYPLTFLGCLGVALIVTWPLVARLTTSYLGDGGDENVFLWSMWWFRKAVTDPHLGLYQTDLMYFPQVTSLLFHTMNELACAMAFPLLSLLPLTVTYNVVWLLLAALAGLSVYALGRYAGIGRGGAGLAAVAMVASPYLSSHVAHLNLVGLWPVPLVALLTLRAASPAGSWRDALWGGFAVAAAQLNSGYYLCMAVVLVAGFGVAPWLYASPRPWRQMLRAWSTLLIGGLLLSPLLVAGWRESGGHYMNTPRGVAAGADVTAYLAPWSRHPVWGAAAAARWGHSELSLGLAVLVLAAIAARRRLRREWAVVGAAGLLLSLGSMLTVGGTSQFPAILTVLTGGAPGAGWGVPLGSSATLILADRIVAVGDLCVNLPLSLPYEVLHRRVPLFRPLTSPLRFGLVVMILAYLLVGQGLDDLLARRRGPVARLWWGLAGALVIFESASWPYPLMPLHIPRVYQALAQDPARYAVLEIPLAPTYASPYYTMPLLYQTVHGKPLLFGRHARAPGDALAFVERNALTRYLRAEAPSRWHTGPYRCPALDAAPDRWAHDAALAATLQAGLAQLRALPCGAIAVHYDLLETATRRHIARLLEDCLHLRRVATDGPTVLYPTGIESGREPVGAGGG